MAKADAKQLAFDASCGGDRLYALSYPEGFFVMLTGFEPHQLYDGYSSEFLSLLRWLYDEGFDMVQFDADAPEGEGVPKFDWGEG
jgi:hypothetical protein